MRYENMIWDYHYTKRQKKGCFSSAKNKSQGKYDL